MKSINRYSITTALFLGVLGCASLWGQDLDFTPDKPDGPAKLQSALWELATPRSAKPVGEAQDTVVVILVPQLGQASASIDTSSLAALGGRVLAQSKSLMRISVPASSLLAVSELPGVRFVRRPYRPHAQETWSEGGRLIKAYDNYYEGVRGQGVKVAVIDGGFKRANRLGGDMPARWRYYDYTGEGIYAGESVHGTGCAEIIHDVAQEAELYLYKVDDLVGLENAKDRAIRDGIDVISHSGSFPTTGFGDGRGRACDIVNDAADNGILWVNSAGNYAERHYEGFWSDSDDDDWHNFGNEDEVLSFEADEGDSISVFLTWNDWPNSRENYDLYLYMDSSDGLERVAESTDRQNVSGGTPVERIEYKAERSGKYGISVRSVNARPKRLKIWSFEHYFEEYAVARSSLGIPADARGSMSVGAVHYDVYNLGWIADYSSRGPTTDGRFKPELVAPSGVSTVSYGKASEKFYGYTGTSAAAPHVAGAAALIKSANPTYSRTQLWNALIAATVDIGTRGRDNTSGYGKLVLPVMQVSASTSTSPWISNISPRTGRANAVVTISGGNFGSSRGSSTVRIGSVVVSSTSFTSWSNTRIRFRIPGNTPPGNLTVRTSKGTSNSIRLQTTSPYLTSISPTRAKTGERLTLRGGNFGTRRGTGYVFFASNIRPSTADYVSWSSSRIVVRVPARARSGNVRVTTSNGTSGTKRLVVESGSSPQITSVSPRQVRYNQTVTVTGRNFGSSRGSSTVRIGSVTIPSSALSSWSNTRIRFRVPTNMRSGSLTVRTSAGTSNAIRLGITSPYLTSISPTRAKTGDRLTLTGGNFGTRRGTGYVFFTSNIRPSNADYVSWSSSRIVVRVPARARSGNVRVTTSNGTSGTKRLVVEAVSPQITSVSPRQVQYNQIVTVTGRNFGSSRGSSTVRIGSVVVPSSSLSSWSNTRIRFRVPTNMRSGSLTVRTSAGTSNAIRLGITSPYLTSISPTRIKTGERLTLTGGNFGTRRGTGYVSFSSNVRPSAADYVSWSSSRIVVRVPARARSGDVKVVTGAGVSGTRRLVVEAVSPQITSVSPRQVLYNQVVTVTGINFGSSRGSSSVRIGSVAIPSSSLDSWSNTTISFRVPKNMRSGNLTVRTSKGTSNAILLEILSPYLSSVSPSSVRLGDRLTLTGANFRSRRGSSYVLFAPSIRPVASDYATWSDDRIVVTVPAEAQSGDVKVVVIGAGVSGTKRIVIGSAASLQITSLSPSRVRYNQVVTIRGTAFGANRGSSRVIFPGGKVPSSSQYVSWSDTQISVRVPTGVRTGNVQVVTSNGSDTVRLTITSPWISSISPQTGRANAVVTISGGNFGSSRGSSTVRIGSVSIPSTAFASWSGNRIRFRIPGNTPPGNLTVRTSEGTSNVIRLQTTSPYLTSISPTRAETGERLTLRGGNFGTIRGTGYVSFASNVRPSAADYVSWSSSRIVVKVPIGARSGNVQVTNSNGTSGTKRLEIEGEQLEPLPSSGIFGYSPPAVSKNPKSVKFGFETTNSSIACYFAVKEISTGEVAILFNELHYADVPKSTDWTDWYIVLNRTDLRSGTNIIEFRNISNQNRTSSFARWQLKDVEVGDRPVLRPSAKPVAGPRVLSKLSDELVSGLGAPFPTPFNAEVTIPFALAEAGPVQISVYNLLGQPIRVLADGWRSAGVHRVRWDGRTAAGAASASGVYWAVLQAGAAVQTAKLALIR